MYHKKCDPFQDTSRTDDMRQIATDLILWAKDILRREREAHPVSE
jgi:hypothetical protein